MSLSIFGFFLGIPLQQALQTGANFGTVSGLMACNGGTGANFGTVSGLMACNEGGNVGLLLESLLELPRPQAARGVLDEMMLATCRFHIDHVTAVTLRTDARATE